MRMFGYWISFLTILSDIVATTVAYWLAYFLRFHLLIAVYPLPSGPPSLRNYIILYLMILIVWPLAFYITRAYRIRHRRSPEEEFFQILTRVALASMIVWALALYYRVFLQRGAPSSEWLEPSRLMFLVFMALDVFTIQFGRIIVSITADRLKEKGWQIRRAVVVGNGVLGKRLVERIQKHPDAGVHLVGFVANTDAPPFQGLRVLGRPRDLPEIIRHHFIDTIFIALPFQDYPRLNEVLAPLVHQPLDIRIVFDTLTYNYLRGTYTTLDDLLIIGVNDTPLNGPGYIIKRILDILLSSTALIALSPLMLLIAIAIRLNSRGPIIYRQIRMGLDGKPFVMYKFRTMVTNAEQGTGPVMAAPDDARVTMVGRILRKFSLDELPQFWNVLKGDMSLVGPRPERPHFVAHFSRRFPQYQLRMRAKGGITGWAQVNGLRGSKSDMEKRIEYDIYYLTHWSLWFDLWILMMTPFRMIRHKGTT